MKRHNTEERADDPAKTPRLDLLDAPAIGSPKSSSFTNHGISRTPFLQELHYQNATYREYCRTRLKEAILSTSKGEHMERLENFVKSKEESVFNAAQTKEAYFKQMAETLKMAEQWQLFEIFIEQDDDGPKMEPGKGDPNVEWKYAMIRNVYYLIKRKESTAFLNPVVSTMYEDNSLIKKPMAFSTVVDRLVKDKYTNPWDYVNDLWEIFQNAALNKSKRPQIYTSSVKLAELAEQNLDPIMRELGYCCGKKRFFFREELLCSVTRGCSIPLDDEYYSYQDKYFICLKCFNSPGRRGRIIKLIDEEAQQLIIEKSQFEIKMNNEMVSEPFVYCKECGKAWHSICAMHIHDIHPEGFTCDKCLAQQAKTKQKNLLSAKDLPTTYLSRFIEKNVNDYLEENDTQVNYVHIRVLASVDKAVKVGPFMAERYASQIPKEYPYRAKAVFAFQEIEGSDVCIFGMYVQEYSAECPGPNARSIYISYLDSVHYFRPSHLRTSVYHEILIGYLKFMKCLGYALAYLWSCPPGPGQDYLFHHHPPEQKIPDHRHLQNWYIRFFDKAISAGVVMEHKGLREHLKGTGIASPIEIPYFDGDLFPRELEVVIKMHKEKEVRYQQGALAQADVKGVHIPVKRKRGRPPKNPKSAQPPPDVMEGVNKLLLTHKNDYFRIVLNHPNSTFYCQPLNDPDPSILNELVDTRWAFLGFLERNRYEFSSLRHAKFSTMALLHQLFKGRMDDIDTGSNNNMWEDYHRFVKRCHKEDHDMERTSPSFPEKKNISWSLIQLHASQCSDINCTESGCRKLKLLISHRQKCPNSENCVQCIALETISRES